MVPAGGAEVQAAAGAEGYNNKYRNGWGASVAAVRAAVEEQRRNKRGTGTPVSQMAAPLPLSRFAWPVSAVRCWNWTCFHSREVGDVYVRGIWADVQVCAAPLPAT